MGSGLLWEKTNYYMSQEPTWGGQWKNNQDWGAEVERGMHFSDHKVTEEASFYFKTTGNPQVYLTKIGIHVNDFITNSTSPSERSKVFWASVKVCWMLKWMTFQDANTLWPSLVFATKKIPFSGGYQFIPYCAFDLKYLVGHWKNIGDIPMRSILWPKSSRSLLRSLFVASILAEIFAVKITEEFAVSLIKTTCQSYHSF